MDALHLLLGGADAADGDFFLQGGQIIVIFRGGGFIDGDKRRAGVDEVAWSIEQAATQVLVRTDIDESLDVDHLDVAGAGRLDRDFIFDFLPFGFFVIRLALVWICGASVREEALEGVVEFGMDRCDDAVGLQ